MAFKLPYISISLKILLKLSINLPGVIYHKGHEGHKGKQLKDQAQEVCFKILRDL
jgi:hypothetical protein